MKHRHCNHSEEFNEVCEGLEQMLDNLPTTEEEAERDDEMLNDLNHEIPPTSTDE